MKISTAMVNHLEQFGQIHPQYPNLYRIYAKKPGFLEKSLVPHEISR